LACAPVGGPSSRFTNSTVLGAMSLGVQLDVEVECLVHLLTEVGISAGERHHDANFDIFGLGNTGDGKRHCGAAPKHVINFISSS